MLLYLPDINDILMANIHGSLVRETFPDLVEKVCTEIKERFARAHQLLLDRERHLLAQVQLWLSDYIERMRVTNTLLEGQDPSISGQLVEQLERNPEGTCTTYKSIALDWDELFEDELRNIGKVVVDSTDTNIPNYQMMSQPVLVSGIRNTTNRSAGVFASPKDIATDPVTDYIYITDMFNRVQVFTQSFEFVFLFSKRMNYPTGICIAQDRVYVTQTLGHRLNVYSTIGKYLESVGSIGNNKLQFHFPRAVDISVDRNRIYIVEYQNRRVQCLNSDLTFHSFITDNQKLKQVKVTSNEIVILRSVIPYLLIYNYEHQLVRTAVRLHVEMNPSRLCIDKVGNYVITDQCEDRIKVFSRNGELIYRIGEKGTNAGQFILPRGILITRECRLVVVSDNPNNTIQMF